MTGQRTKTRNLAEKFDLASFEGVAYVSVKTLYPDIGRDLLEQLTQSMSETYLRFLRRKYRHEHLRTPRSRPRTTMPLSSIKEWHDSDSELEGAMDIPTQEHRASEDFVVRILQRRSAHLLPISEPTSIDSQEVQRRFKRRLSTAVNYKTTSIFVNQVDYPQPKKGSLTCEWCFSPLPAGSSEGEKWRYETFEPIELF